MAVGKKSIMRAANAGETEKPVQFMAESDEGVKKEMAEEMTKTAATKATTTNAAVKKTAAKKPAAKKPAVSKPAARKPAAKKTVPAQPKVQPKQNYYGVNDELPVYLL